MNLSHNSQTRLLRWFSSLILIALLLNACQPDTALSYSDRMTAPLFPNAEGAVDIQASEENATRPIPADHAIHQANWWIIPPKLEIPWLV